MCEVESSTYGVIMNLVLAGCELLLLSSSTNAAPLWWVEEPPENLVTSLHQLSEPSQTGRCWPFGGTKEENKHAPLRVAAPLPRIQAPAPHPPHPQPCASTPPGWTQQRRAGRLLTERVSSLLLHARVLSPPTQLAAWL